MLGLIGHPEALPLGRRVILPMNPIALSEGYLCHPRRSRTFRSGQSLVVVRFTCCLAEHVNKIAGRSPSRGACLSPGGRSMPQASQRGVHLASGRWPPSHGVTPPHRVVATARPTGPAPLSRAVRGDMRRPGRTASSGRRADVPAIEVSPVARHLLDGQPRGRPSRPSVRVPEA